MSDKTKADFDEAALKKALDETYGKIEGKFGELEERSKEALNLSTESKQELDKLVEESKDIAGRLADLEAKGGNQDGDGERRKSVGRLFAESDEMKAFRSGQTKSIGMEQKTTLTNATRDGSQPLVSPDHIVDPKHNPNRRVFLWDRVAKGNTDSNVIAFPRETFTNNAGPQVAGSPLAYTEGATKPESGVSFTRVDRPVETIAHFIPVSKQMLQDAAFIQSYVENRLLYHLKLKNEALLLNGTGASGEYYGINTEAEAFAPSSPDTANILDRIRRAKTQASVDEYMANTVILNPEDWEVIETLKINSSDDRYVYGDPKVSGPKTLWGMEVIETNAQTAGQFTVGDLDIGAMLFEAEGLTVGAYYEDSDNVRKNLVTLLAENRASLAVWRQEAFRYGATTGV